MSEIDIEAIRDRHLHPVKTSGRTMYEGHIAVDLALCIGEVVRLRDEIERLRSIMWEGANEIEDHWDAHLDKDGAGPLNLVRRLRTGKGDYRRT